MDRRNFLRFGLAAAATAGLPLSAQAKSKDSMKIADAIRRSYRKAEDAIWKYVTADFRLEYKVLKDLKDYPLKWVYLSHTGPHIGERELRYEVSEPNIELVSAYIEQDVGVIRQEVEGMEAEEAAPILLFVGEDRYQVDPYTLICTPLENK